MAARLREDLDYPVLIVNGGAILDFFGGKVRRAPTLSAPLDLSGCTV